MKHARAWFVWLALALCAVLVIGAMSWLTRGVLASERDRVAAERDRTAAEARADLEERTRLALWRMDALGSSIMLRENRYPANPCEIPADSPWLQANPPEVRLRFEIRKGGEPTALTEISGSPTCTAQLKESLRLLRELLANNPLPGDAWTQLNRAEQQGQVSWEAMPKDASLEQDRNTQVRLNKKGEALRQDVDYQALTNTIERAQRAKAVAQSVNNANDSAAQMKQQAETTQQAADTDAASLSAAQGGIVGSVGGPRLPAVVEVAQMRAVWVGGELFLLRQVFWNFPATSNAVLPGNPSRDDKKSFVQGVWLDARVLSTQLLDEVADLLPQARLLSVDTRAATDPLAMVSFPFRLDRNEVVAAIRTPVHARFGAPLWIAWSAVALAVLTSSLLVSGVMRLSERRASFVSAVTHELRTPLTTFRLYSEMLETGAVKPERRSDYLRVLSREADRLSHLVENVLAFSRIERGNARSNVRDAEIGSLLEQARERLESRLATAGMSLDMDSSSTLRVHVDTAAVEHILFNLIDNAAKYAARSDPPVVEIRVQGAGRNVEIQVRDQGPGIPPGECGRIFRAFHKSAREAAESQPGVGLGLALSRRLAKAQGGDLGCAASSHGACFILRLPAA